MECINYGAALKIPIRESLNVNTVVQNTLYLNIWLLSDDAKDLIKRCEKENGWKYLNTYFPILGFGDDAIEDWFEAPNWAALGDKTRTSKTMVEWSDKTWDFIDMTRSASSSVYRITADVMITAPPKKKK